MIFFLELEENLKLFVEKETTDFLDERAKNAIEKAKSGLVDVEDVIKFWERNYKEVRCGFRSI